MGTNGWEPMGVVLDKVAREGLFEAVTPEECKKPCGKNEFQGGTKGSR